MANVNSPISDSINKKVVMVNKQIQRLMYHIQIDGVKSNVDLVSIEASLDNAIDILSAIYKELK